jgi:hypothetical protein
MTDKEKILSMLDFAVTFRCGYKAKVVKTAKNQMRFNKTLTELQAYKIGFEVNLPGLLVESYQRGMGNDY